MTFFRAICLSSRDMFGIIFRYRRLLASITRVELAKRHAGSILGMVWVILQPALLLSVYLFVYMVVFQIPVPGIQPHRLRALRVLRPGAVPRDSWRR